MSLLKLSTFISQPHSQTSENRSPTHFSKLRRQTEMKQTTLPETHCFRFITMMLTRRKELINNNGITRKPGCMAFFAQPKINFTTPDPYLRHLKWQWCLRKIINITGKDPHALQDKSLLHHSSRWWSEDRLIDVIHTIDSLNSIRPFDSIGLLLTSPLYRILKSFFLVQVCMRG